jgi:hypothetical protein
MESLGMIDWITAVIPCCHAEPINGGEIISTCRGIAENGQSRT